MAAPPLLHRQAEEQAQAGDRGDVQVQHRLDAVQVLRVELLEEEHPGIVDQHVGQDPLPETPGIQLIGGPGLRQVLEAGPDPYGERGRKLSLKLGSSGGKVIRPVAYEQQVITTRSKATGEFQSHSGTATCDQCDHRASALSTSRRRAGGRFSTQWLQRISSVYIRPMQ